MAVIIGIQADGLFCLATFLRNVGSRTTQHYIPEDDNINKYRDFHGNVH
jgi:hypothetical protein